MKEAMLYRKHDDGTVHCRLCNHYCVIADEDFGFCGVRENRGGVLFTHAYGRVVAANEDPIEKKPFYHFLPGSRSFSIATAGCNFRCGFCQNWQISQTSGRPGGIAGGRPMTPSDIVDQAITSGCRSIAYTYTEPTIFFEYAYDTAAVASERGLYNVFVTNGYMTPEALDVISPTLSACNVDLKSFRKEFYREVCQGRLKPVLTSIEHMKHLGLWVEITTLVVPGVNDQEAELTDIARFIASVDPDIPWHISRFHPDYEFMEYETTPLATLKEAYAIGKNEGLRFIYTGNVHGESTDTRCPHCGEPAILRPGYGPVKDRLIKGRCPGCDRLIPGVFGQ